MAASVLHLSFSRKLLLTFLGILLASALMAGYVLNSLHYNLMDDRHQSIRQHVENAISLVKHFHQNVQDGVSEEAAQQQALAAIRNLSYGEDGYFWVNDMDTLVLAHPIKPELEGTLQHAFQDSHGQFIFRNFVAVAANQKSGFVRYFWPKPDSTEPVAKLSYIELYEPWGWVLGSGLYLDDIEDALWAEIKILLTSFGLLLVVLCYLLWSALYFDARAFESNKLMMLVMEACAEAIVITDKKLTIIWVNSAFERLTGYSKREIYGKKPNQLISSGKQDEEFYRVMWSYLNRGQHWSGELINRRKNGEYYHEEMTITPVKNRTGVVSHYVAIKSNISRRKEDQLRLERLATKDGLTGVLNRRGFIDHLSLHLKSDAPVKGVIMMLDLDHFKQINDNYGHQCGDHVLMDFARLISGQLRENDLFGRLGGEEFGLVVPDVSFEVGMKIAERICESLKNHSIMFNEHDLVITASIGITQILSNADKPDVLLDLADKGLYLAKRDGRACVRRAA